MSQVDAAPSSEPEANVDWALTAQFTERYRRGQQQDPAGRRRVRAIQCALLAAQDTWMEI